jgi:hypothetical protein
MSEGVGGFLCVLMWRAWWERGLQPASMRQMQQSPEEIKALVMRTVKRHKCHAPDRSATFRSLQRADGRRRWKISARIDVARLAGARASARFDAANAAVSRRNKSTRHADGEAA